MEFQLRDVLRTLKWSTDVLAVVSRLPGGASPEQGASQPDFGVGER